MHDRIRTPVFAMGRAERIRGGGATGTTRMELGVFRMTWIWGREIGACPARDLPKVSIRVKPARNQRTPPAVDVLAVLAQLDGWPRLAVSEKLVALATPLGARGGYFKWAEPGLLLVSAWSQGCRSCTARGRTRRR